MPNHVHVLIEPLGGELISKIVQSWKSYTAKANLPLCPVGVFGEKRHVWQPDYYDRFIRNERHYAAAVDYIHRNPVKAGLVERPEEWPCSSAAGSAAGPAASASL